MALHDLSLLDVHKTGGFPPGYLDFLRTFYAPVDDVHGVLKDILSSVSVSVAIGMYGFDDLELADIVRKKLEDSRIFVQLSLDSSQAAGVHERELLEREDYPASSIAVGTSEKSRIMHLKSAVIDGLDVVMGSTNWSSAGETLQDNELLVVRHPLVAAEARARLDTIHHHMLQAAARRKPA